MHEHNKVTVTKPDGTVVLDMVTDDMLLLYTGGDSPEGQQGCFLNGTTFECHSLAASFLVSYEEEHPELALFRAMIPKPDFMGILTKGLMGNRGAES